jgi:hypothetical protein
LNREHSSPPSIKVTALFGSIALTGDQDLNLRLFTTTGPVVSRPACRGTALDFVCFTANGLFERVIVAALSAAGLGFGVRRLLTAA